MRFSICNLGCKVNAYEAESVASILEGRGWSRVPFEEEADAALIFTCAVTNMAAQKSRKMMHRARRKNPEVIIAMVGCYAQIDDGMLDDAEIIVGTANKGKLADYLQEYIDTGTPVRALNDLEGEKFEPLLTDQFENRSRAYLKIQDGCNQFCTFCIIPYARGRERSMDPDLAVAEAKRIAQNYKEIVLTGIHTGRYGKEYGITLTDLMKRILNEVPQIERLRISSIEVTELTPDLIDLMKNDRRVARHLHIPLQSGCDSVLARMHRPYTCGEYYDTICRIREEIPDISISNDLIVGFPQETDEEFEETVAFLKKCRFSFLHVFPYSSRKGTAAAAMSGHIDPKIKKERTRICTALSQELADDFARQYEGREADVIAETYSDGYTSGYTSQYISVRMKGEVPHGQMVHVILKEYRDHRMYAEEAENNETE